MKISVIQYPPYAAEIVIQSDNINYTEKVVSRYISGDNLVKDLITSARDIYALTGMTDVMFVNMVAHTFLNSDKRKELIESWEGTK